MHGETMKFVDVHLLTREVSYCALGGAGVFSHERVYSFTKNILKHIANNVYK